MKKQILHGILILISLSCVNNKAFSQNLIASYPLNGNANDISGNNLNGTIIGTPAFVTDRFGNANSAIAISGNLANRIEVDDNALLHLPSITISAWVKEIGINAIIKTIVDKPLGTGASDSWHLGVITNGGDLYSSWIFNDPGSATGSQITAPAYIGDWHYIVFTFDNNSKLHKLYVDGVLRSTNTLSNTIGYDNSKMYIGAALENNGLSFPMDGELDDIKIYDAALSAQQIASDYSAGITYNNPGSGSAIQFNGTASQYYAQLPSLLDGTNVFTVDFWVKTTESGSNPTYWQNPTLVGNVNPSSPDGDFGITLNNGQIGVWSGICSCGDQVLQTTKAINDNNWHHVAAVNDGSKMVLYIDGMLLSGSIPTSGGALQTAARPWSIGKGNSCCSNGSPANATIDEFRIWDTALSQTQIRDRMCKKTTSSDGLYGNLLAYYHFNETIGTSLVDSKNNNIAFLNDGTRLLSAAPVGDAAAHDYMNAVKSVSINNSNGESITVTSTSGNPDGIQVYGVEEQPNTVDGVITLGNPNKYFGVFQSGGSTPQYNTVYNYTGNPYVTAANENTLALYKRTDNAVTTWTNGFASLNTSAKSLTLSGQSTEYLLGASGPLPLQLLSFTAGNQGLYALLKWTTTAEINCSHFEIERSNSGALFQNIGSISAINNNAIHHYNFVDNTPLNNINYYRLKMVDRDGHYTFSPIVKVSFRNNNPLFSIFPVPAINTITIKYSGHQKIIMMTIFDATGKKVFAQKIINQSVLVADISQLSKGIYTVQLDDGTKPPSIKLIKM
ncbi:T9SS type A sorting domain-containing protein [Pedobacter sp. SD-b]|uniref:T9SS type A sorting domain-containing protein n=1 Tax=Pedobacter segetis TaxID=2793069 RepID=A0ABS1BKP3_9SPHI|nr:LamG-like jellyroll fold domain-containing protein [Pedobacter segetis]MBK0383464.1 T9SS type A sorting domain-containing protein [Pedobacter segetis]